MKKTFLLLIYICAIYTACFAKDFTLSKANSYFQQEMYDQALPLYLELYNRDTSSTEYSLAIGICYLNAAYHRVKALPYLEDATYAADTIPEAFYYLGQAYHLANDFDAAVQAYEKFKTFIEGDSEMMALVDRELEMINNARYFFANHSKEEIKNMGNTINSTYSEYTPLITGDESILVFTYQGEGSTGGLRDVYGRPDTQGSYYEDVYISVQDEGKWSKPVGISDSINTVQHDACIGFSSNGEKLYIYKSDDKGYGDIWVSNKLGIDWSTPKKLPEPVNSDYWEGGASITDDDQVIYFSSNRPNGKGGKDIYRSLKQPNGSWGQPTLLNIRINTPYDEDAPFFHSPTNTLYFSSRGHNSMGGFDIFKSEFRNGAWSDPVNMGFPINTTDDDIYFVLSTDGNTGYLSSERVRNCFGRQDIYKVFMNNYVLTDTAELALVKGLVKKDDQPIEGTIQVTNLINDSLIGTYKSDSESGKYIFSLPVGTTYILQVKVDGYPDKIDTIEIKDRSSFNLFVKDFLFGENTELDKLSENAFGIAVYFAFDKSDLTSNGEQEKEKLNTLIKYLNQNPTYKVELLGHTDSKGSLAYNTRLSKQRNNEVKKYLMEQGIKSSSIAKEVGYGETVPKADNDTEKGRALNRRVEVKVVKE